MVVLLMKATARCYVKPIIGQKVIAKIYKLKQMKKDIGILPNALFAFFRGVSFPQIKVNA